MKQADRTGVEPVSDIEFTSAPYLVDKDVDVKIILNSFDWEKENLSLSEINGQCELTWRGRQRLCIFQPHSRTREGSRCEQTWEQFVLKILFVIVFFWNQYLSSWTSYSPLCSRSALQRLIRYSTISTLPRLHAMNSGEQPSLTIKALVSTFEMLVINRKKWGFRMRDRGVCRD